MQLRTAGRFAFILIIAVLLSGCISSRGPVISDNELVTPLPTKTRLVEIDASGNPQRNMLGVSGINSLSLKGKIYSGLIKAQDDDYVDRFGATPFGPPGQYLIQARKQGTDVHWYLFGIIDRKNVLTIFYIQDWKGFKDRMSALGFPSTVTERSELVSALTEAINANYFRQWKRFRVFDMNGDRRAYADFLECRRNCT